ncbi:mucosal addressin cell adhesion molecule 1 isoform X2 [Candoia aspera]|uniref:mucosal addressin cell adhesion molecule 1 isoform X2 n=1 Tax=Candoia aspera TaxID=51853 RepID=UPI002FD7D7BF
MKGMAVISFVLLFSLVCCSCSHPTSKPTIQPQKPLVERGGAIQLVCSMDCPGAEVQWEGLDTDLGNIVSNYTHSILTLTNATINMEGTKSCSGGCQGTPSLEKVELNVYSPQEVLRATGSTILTLTSGKTSQTAAPELPTTADWKSSFGTTTSPLPLVSTNYPTSGASVVTATATLESPAKDKNSVTVVSNTTGSSCPTDQEFTTQPLPTSNSFSTESATEKPEDPCCPVIIPVPAVGITGDALRITCQAAGCGKGIQIQWVETPMAQSQYHLEEAEGQSTLMVESVGLEHQGVYQCVAMASQPRIASLDVTVSPGE